MKTETIPAHHSVARAAYYKTEGDRLIWKGRLYEIVSGGKGKDLQVVEVGR
jgi:hypothetical protein